MIMDDEYSEEIISQLRNTYTLQLKMLSALSSVLATCHALQSQVLELQAAQGMDLNRAQQRASVYLKASKQISDDANKEFLAKFGLVEISPTDGFWDRPSAGPE